MLYVSGSTGFRPPEMTEIYRLQRQQAAADLDSEKLESVEGGWKLRSGDFSLTTALFAMKKTHLILRDSNAFNVSNGATNHRGFEYEARWRVNQVWSLSAAGTVARHEYAFSRNVEGGESITAGNDVDTAPRQLHNLGIDARFSERLRAGLTASHVGRYFVDAANTASYPGHEVFNLNVEWLPHSDLRATLRVDNLLDAAYADRADFAFGNYRYFPARGRAVFLSLDFVTR
jgi:iron complex outermembrane recepter protein